MDVTQNKSNEDDIIKQLTEKYCNDIENAPFYKTFYKNLKRVTALSKEINLSSFEDSLIKTIKNTGLENDLRNDVYYWIKERNLLQSGVGCWMEKEPMEYLREAQMQWEKRVYRSINSMCTELKVSLSLLRLASDRDEITEKWNMLSTYPKDLTQYRPVYAPKDFLKVLLNIRNPNIDTTILNDKNRDFGLVSLKVNSLQDLKLFYADMVSDEPLLGTFHSSSPVYFSLEERRISLGENILKSRQAPVTQTYLKRLAPHSLRSRLWAQLLGSEILPWHKEYFKNLKSLVAQYDMLVDKLIFKDIQLTVCNDDQYFVFEDSLNQVLLCFSRDTTVANVFRRSSSNPALAILKGKSNIINNAVIYPLNGVIPFYGFSMYAAPLCYIYSDPVQLYFTFRSLYLRYWFRLHEVNSHPQGILSLSILFQRLLETHEPQLSQHFASIEIQPIRIVFKWLMKCFSGYLPPEQLLYLWDLVLGYDSLEIISLLAVAILSSRKSNLLQVDVLQNVEAVLDDLSSIQVIPLLQFVIVSD